MLCIVLGEQIGSSAIGQYLQQGDVASLISRVHYYQAIQKATLSL